MSDIYFVPSLNPPNIHRREVTIQHSKFIMNIAYTPTPEEAKSFIIQIRNTFKDATHNCWAFIAGNPSQTTHIGYSDDGEPHGTAGRPILSILLHNNIGDITVVVTRYFGGVKLGTGGLVRAYQQITQLGLETLPLQQYLCYAKVNVVIDYKHITSFLHLLTKYHASIIEEVFTNEAAYTLILPKEQLLHLQSELMELTHGTISFTLIK